MKVLSFTKAYFHSASSAIVLLPLFTE